MAVLRIRKSSNFVVLDKTCTQDRNLSLQAKGLHSMLMGFPDDWKINLKDISNRSTNGRDAVRKALNELIKSAYVQREEVRNEGRFSGHEYLVFEQPDFKVYETTPAPENPSTVDSPWPGKPTPVLPAPENPTLLNNNNTKNKLTNSTVSLPVGEKEQGIVSEEVSESLTESQVRYLKGTFKRLQEQGVRVSDPERVFNECTWAILNPEQMKGITNFKHRVNIVSKLLRRKRWLTPKGFHSHSEIGKYLKHRDDERILTYEKIKRKKDNEKKKEITSVKNAIKFRSCNSLVKKDLAFFHGNNEAKCKSRKPNENSTVNQMQKKIESELYAEKRYLQQLLNTYAFPNEDEKKNLENNVKNKILNLKNELKALEKNNKDEGEKNAEVA